MISNLTLNKNHLKQAITCCLIFVVMSCADPNKPYSPEMKHKIPNLEYMADLDMYRSPSYETYSENPNFADDMTARIPVEGTIPRGYMLYPYPNTNEGYEDAGENLKNPIPWTLEILEEGKDLFMKFCIHCHGPEGKGDGVMILNEKFPPPPSYSTGLSSGGGKMSDLPEGKIFHAITFGKNLMGPHASQLNHEERWKIVHYVQTLQRLADEQESAETDEKPSEQPAEKVTKIKLNPDAKVTIENTGDDKTKVTITGVEKEGQTEKDTTNNN